MTIVYVPFCRMASSTMPRVSSSGRTWLPPIRVAGEHDVGWDTATTDFVQCACDLRIVASPICAQQNVMPAEEALAPRSCPAGRLSH